MIKVLFSIFLLINSIFGLLFYEGTVFGSFLKSSESISLIFIFVNFIVSNLILIFMRIMPFSILGAFLTFLLLFLIIVIVCIYVPYWVFFEFFKVKYDSFFFWTIYALIEIGILTIILAPVLRGLINFLQQFNEAFFEGLKENAINNALGKKNKF
jgi:hypothetical protein